ncbi:hypothetical protein JCM10207_003455 [Rhodosporidiobolus poonsookiae]
MANNAQLPGVDRLSNLPFDILKVIFEHAYGREAYSNPAHPKRLAALCKPLNHLLYPLQRDQLFSEVLIQSHYQLNRFAKSILGNVTLANTVTSIWCEVKWHFAGSVEVKLKEENETDADFISNTTLSRLFDAVVNLESLVVVGSSHVATEVFRRSASPTRLSKLKSLDLHSEFDMINDPLSAVFLAPLARLPKLRNLTINLERDLKTIKEDNRVPLTQLWLPTVKYLSLRGPLAQCKDVGHLLSAVSTLTDLALEDTGKVKAATWASTLLGALLMPHLLTGLRLVRIHPTHANDISSALEAFPALKTLSVGGAGVILKPAFYDALTGLPVETLVYELDLRGVKCSDLTKLVKGKKAHATLSRLILDHIANDEDEGHFPTWTRSFTPAQLEKFVGVAEEEGLELEGTAIWALEQDEEMDLDDLLAMIPVLKERWRQRAINMEQMCANGGFGAGGGGGGGAFWF